MLIEEGMSKNIWDWYSELSLLQKLLFREYILDNTGARKGAFYAWRKRRYIPAKYHSVVKEYLEKHFPEVLPDIDIPTDRNQKQNTKKS